MIVRRRPNVNRRTRSGLPAACRRALRSPAMPGKMRAHALRAPRFRCWLPPRLNPTSKGQAMKNYLDGGEAILEAFRKLKIDYIMSSPGSEWSPLWEALARQKLGNTPGPTFMESWHETVAVNMASGYTLMTGRPQAVLLHAAVGMLQGSMGVHSAMQNEVPMVVMSGEFELARRGPRPRHRAAVVWRAHRRRHRAVRRAGRQVGAVGDEPLHALRERGPCRRDGAARPDGSDLSQRPARAHAARLDAAAASARRSGRHQDAGACRRTCSRSPTCCRRRRTRSWSWRPPAAIRRPTPH